MKTTHRKLVEGASMAINAVFADKTVPHEETLDSLSLLCDEIDILMDAVGEEIERRLSCI